MRRLSYKSRTRTKPSKHGRESAAVSDCAKMLCVRRRSSAYKIVTQEHFPSCKSSLEELLELRFLCLLHHRFQKSHYLSKAAFLPGVGAKEKEEGLVMTLQWLLKVFFFFFFCSWFPHSQINLVNCNHRNFQTSILYSSCNTVKLQIFVRYPFSYFWLETGSYELIFVLSRALKQNYIEIRWPQDKNKFSSGIKFRTFFKSTKVRK